MLNNTDYTISRIREWFRRAKPVWSQKNQNVQLGCHFEEVAEMLETIHCWGPEGIALRNKALFAVTALSEHMKTTDLPCMVEVKQEKAFIDSVCDQIVTLIGSVHNAPWNTELDGALEEVDRSNWSKFDESGQPILDENGKITKGPNYTAPNLDPFIEPVVS